MSKQQRAEKENEFIEQSFNRLLNDYLASPHGKKTDIIKKAFTFAKNAHEGIRRLSGEPYILHPIAVAEIVCKEIGLGSTSICAALLHDVVEDTEYTVEDIRNIFGDKIALIVDGLTKISGGVFGTHASLQAENFKKLIITMNRDIRVVLIKIADRLHNMRTLDAQPTEKQYKIAGETEYIYAPLAHRLGLFEIKTELENLTFKYNSPQEYNYIQQRVDTEKARRMQIYDRFALPIMNKLNAVGIQFVMKERIKSAYSIWKKMHKKHIPFEEIYDIVGSRIVFTPKPGSDEREECWKIYNIITQIYTPHPDRTRDWISTPKTNGYEALHVTVMGPDGFWIEVQIRSKRMDDIAEKGLAAHWNYKKDYSASESRIEEWLNTVNELLKKPDSDAMEFLDTFKLALYDAELMIFTPDGEMKTMPAGSTVLDFAYESGEDNGRHCMAAKVNNKLVPVNHILHSGDQVEIITSVQKEPLPEYLAFVSTVKAKEHITAALKENAVKDRAEGETMLLKELESTGCKIKDKIPQPVKNKLLRFYGYDSYDHLLEDIKKHNVDLSDLKNALKQKNDIFTLQFWTPNIFKKKNTDKPENGGNANGTESKNPECRHYTETENDFVIAKCCNPLPGDEIVGFKGTDGQITIHRTDCDHAMKEMAQNGTNIVAVEWENRTMQYFPAKLEIKGIENPETFRKIILELTGKMHVNIQKLTYNTLDGIFEMRTIIRVFNSDMIARICEDIKNMEGISNVSRIED